MNLQLFICKYLLFSFIFLAQSIAISGEKEIQLSSHNKKAIEVYNENGTKISGCQGASFCVDPLPPDAIITYHAYDKKIIYNPTSGQREERLLYNIRYGYRKGNMWIGGTGWIDAGYTTQPHLNISMGSKISGPVVKPQAISPSKPAATTVISGSTEGEVTATESIPDPEKPEKQKMPPKPQQNKPKMGLRNSPTQSSTPLGQSFSMDFEKILQRIDQDTALENIRSINRDSSKLINAGIGKCIATENEIKEKLHNKWEGKDFIYDEVFLPEALKLKAKPLDIKDENNKPISDQDLREIDVLARTIYAEVSNCFELKIKDSTNKVIATKETLEYPMFVAATAKNRVDYIENVGETTEFVKGNHHKSKGTYAKVLTTKWQYSPWNKPKPKLKITNVRDDYKALRLLLCPPRKTNETYYQGSKPPPKDVEHFEIAVKMAMEAVLYPTLFSARAHEFWQFYFTSDKSSFHSMNELIPSIHGRQLDNKKCINVWDGLPAGFSIDAKTKKSDPKFYKFVESRLKQNKVHPDSISDKDTGRKRRALVTYHFYESQLKGEHASSETKEPQVQQKSLNCVS